MEHFIPLWLVTFWFGEVVLRSCHFCTALEVNNAANFPHGADGSALFHCWTGPRARRVDLIDPPEALVRERSVGFARSMFDRRQIPATVVWLEQDLPLAGSGPAVTAVAKGPAAPKRVPRQHFPA